MPSYKVSMVPIPPTDSDITKYRDLRLLSLHTDPTKFGSTYEREIAFTPEQWRGRLDSAHKVVVIVSCTKEFGEDNLSVMAESGDSGDWVGMVTITAPSEPTGFVLPGSVADVNTLVYALFGMWVHPAHRRRGLGVQLVEAGLDWVRGNRDPNDVTGRMHKMVGLKVEEHNEDAATLYRKTGFRALPRDEKFTFMVADVYS